MGKRQEGFQQGNSYGAPYRYNEDTWADDMEWAAAELFKATRKPAYLADAKRYAKIAGTTSWMQHRDGTSITRCIRSRTSDISRFIRSPTRKPNANLPDITAAASRRSSRAAKTNPYGVGVPFLWCSNNLVVAFITQVHLYERMTGDKRYHASMLAHRDWLFGRNPWGTSMFEGIPAGGEYPEDTHLPTVQLLKKQVRGGLVDGPIAGNNLQRLDRPARLTKPDEFAEFQPQEIVYHDDVGDYSTNEPTMDGTADAILMMAMLEPSESRSAKLKCRVSNTIRAAIIRGEVSQKNGARFYRRRICRRRET